MHTRRWIHVCGLLLSAGLLFASAAASAQVAASDKAAAEALFDRGITLMREGKLDEACARFEQSQAIERGIGTMLYLAECYEKTGRTASAWALFREAASEAQAAGQAERAQAGRQRAERLEPILSKLTVEIAPAARVDGLVILRNGAAIPSSVWGIPLPVDPGPLNVEARAPGYQPWSHQITIEKGPAQQRVDVDGLMRAAEQPKLVTAPIEAAPAAAPAPAPAPVERRPNKLKIAGIVVGAAGVAMLALGAGFGGRAIRQKNKADDNGCSHNVCDISIDETGLDANQSAANAARIADIGFIAGGVLLAGGLLTYFLAPDSETKVGVSADAHSASLSIGGVF